MANDIVEVNSSSDEEDSRRPSKNLSPTELGKILEEELFEEKSCSDGDEEKVYLVRRKNKKGKGKKDKSNGKEMWEARRSFTLEVEELERRNKKRPQPGDIGVNKWSKKIVNLNEWNDDEIVTEEEVEAEDIFADWVKLLNKQIRMSKKEIEEVFWDITLTKKNNRPRKLSEVLDNLPLEDQPDVLGDKAEAAKKRKARQAKRRPAKLYWNIFEDWKRNLDEERAMRRKMQRNRRQRRRPKQRYTKKRRNNTPEDQSEVKRGTRRPREEEGGAEAAMCALAFAFEGGATSKAEPGNCEYMLEFRSERFG